MTPLKNPAPAVNLPNILTLSRILVSPLLVIFLIRGMYGHALLIFALAGVSDGLDGLLARWLDQGTLIGAYLDPIADKILIMSAFISLAVLGIAPPWVAVIIISRDILIVIGMVVLSFNHIRVEIRPSLVSKFNTCAQITLVIAILIDRVFSDSLGMLPWLCWVTAGLTILSGLHYIYKGMNIFQDAHERG
ncbi:MAG: CDP-alcohol phosphatidyltransferase family protein [Desulfobacterales bacterium]|nr:CDP-alcohol phosphatidyltransferase family protein [Desulfobacterales bacterium]